MTRPFGKTGLEVHPLGFGGSEIGYWEVPPAEVEVLLNDALDAGMNVIDTAECYRDSEEKIGETVASRRDEYFLFTKCGHNGADLGGEDWDPDVLRRSIDRSLSRLRTDRVDLVQLHSCPRETLERGEVIAVLEEAKAAGKTRLIGYSGDNDAAAYAVSCGRFDALQTSYNVADQANGETISAAGTAGMGVIVKRPIANAAWSWEPPVGDYSRTYYDRLVELAYPSLDAETALRFTLAHEGVSVAIVGTTKPGRWSENRALLDRGPLEPEHVAAIRERWSSVAHADWVGLT